AVQTGPPDFDSLRVSYTLCEPCRCDKIFTKLVNGDFMTSKNRRSFLKAGMAATGAAAASGAANAQTGPVKKVHYRGAKPAKPPLFSGAVSYGNLLFIAGKGAHFAGDIKAHTKHVLDEIQKELDNAGSSMEKVLQCRVFLA